MASHLDRLKLARLHISVAKERAQVREPLLSIEELTTAIAILDHEIQWLKQLEKQAKS